jgi:hypothetical protein
VSAREQFLAGERPDDLALFLAESYLTDPDAVGGHAERVEDGVVLVVDGERGRELFGRVTGVGAMEFAQQAGREGHVERDLAGGECPEDGDGGEHHVEFVLAFAQEQNREAGGLYAEGDVVHAYAYCACGEAYSERWVAGAAD